MAGLESVGWPPPGIETKRLVLREPEARDRALFVQLFTSEEVGTYIGGARPRAEFERALPAVPEGRPGLFVVDVDGSMVGVVTLDQRCPDYLVRPAAGKVELGYLFLPAAWGRGYAAEACAAALGWFADACPGEAVALTTQTANGRSMRLAAKLGFAEAERFEQFGAEQWFGVRVSDHAVPATPSTAEQGDRRDEGHQ